MKNSNVSVKFDQYMYITC